MAQDLSQTIQEGLAQTLTDLLGIDAKFQETTKTDKRDIEELQLLQVNAEFEFDKLSTILKFMIPASTASIIFNTMMGSTEYDISDTIDDDTTDAMGEFVSNVSGSLVTAFNAKEVEELGKAKFNIKNRELLESSSIEDIDTLYRFIIELDDTPLTLFVNFDEEFLPFIEEITKAEPTIYPEEETPQLEEESIEELSEEITPTEETPETPDPESIITNDKEEEKEDSSENEETIEEDEETIKKAKKMKLLIIILSSLVGLIIIIFLVIFLMSSPEEDEMENANPKTEQTKENTDGEKNPEQEELKITPNKTLKKIDFNIKDIDIARLNGRLATLSKYEVLTKEELEVQQKEEAIRLEKLKQEEELKEFAKLNKEEPVKLKEKPAPKKEKSNPILVNKKEQIVMPAKEIKAQVVEEKTIPETKMTANTKTTPDNLEVTITEPQVPQQLLFILTNSIKYTLFKSLVVKTNSSTARISMCNDDEGRTTILIGPFENKEQQNKMDQLIKDSNENVETSLKGLNLDEFNQRCNF